MSGQNYQNHQNRLNRLFHRFRSYQLEWRSYFPFPELRPEQEWGMEIVSKQPKVMLEQGPGAGKTGQGVGFLRALREAGFEGAFVYATSTKALVNQVLNQHPDPDVKTVYGRNEYDCLYYQARGIEAKADEVPCSMLVRQQKCPHHIPSLDRIPRAVKPCPYFLDKVKAEQEGKITVCTTAYFLINKLYLDHPPKIAGLVLDEVHQIAKVARTVFTYDITDWHLKRLVQFLEEWEIPQAEGLRAFLMEMIKIAQLKPARQPTLLEPHEIEHLLSYLEGISFEEAQRKLEAGLARGEIDPVKYQEELVTFERINRDLRRYISSFKYSLKEEKRNPLAYIFAYYEKRIPPEQKVRYKLCVRAHYVAPLIKVTLEGIDHILGYSATIGDPEIFGPVETGIEFPVYTCPSAFPKEHAKIYLPNDTPNLALRKRGRLDLHTALRKTVEAALEFQSQGIRSLVVVVSEAERQKFLGISQKLGLNALSYGDGLKPRESALRFLNGQGSVLVGTSANYSHGIDLPGKTAPVIFFLRPGYPRPQDPASQFEERRFEKGLWRLWTWRVLIEALQVRGRNIRSAEDFGVAFLISQQFGGFLPGGLPEWLQDAWNDGKPLKEQVKEAISFLKGG